MMRLHLQGGFGEKGRTSVGVEGGGTYLMLDAGISVGAAGDDYHPRLGRPAHEIDALFISHAHEDHVGALWHLIAGGFRGPVYMTRETAAQYGATLAQYAQAADLAVGGATDPDIRLMDAGGTVRVGGLTVSAGRSGHVSGGVWFAVEDRQARCVVYSADVVPDSAVFEMTPLPRSDLLILDGSYGTDTLTSAQRAAEIVAWLAAHPGPSVLPTPLSGRSLELLAIIETPVAIACGMRDALSAQIAGVDVRVRIVPLLRARLQAARDWATGAPLPDCPLLVHDGMGTAGPSVTALAAARTGHIPVLLTGHLPDGSPALGMRREGRADWIRMPTHPTLPENLVMWNGCGQPPLLAHSCDSPTLAAMAGVIPGLDPAARTGDIVTV